MTATIRGISVDGRDGSADVESGVRYRVVYYVSTDDVNDGPQVVRAVSGIPSLGDVYSVGNDHDPQAIAIQKNESQRDDPREWEVEVVYGTATIDLTGVNRDDPFAEPPQLSLGAQSRQLVIPGFFNDPEHPDAQRNKEIGLVNSAGEKFDPAAEMEISDPVFTVTKNMQSASIVWLADLANAVNGTEFYGAEPRTFRISAPQATRVYHAAVGYYWSVTFELIYRWDTWDLQLLNEGSFYLDANNKPVNFQGEKGHSRTGLLRDDGKPLHWGQAEQYYGRYMSISECQTAAIPYDAPTFKRYRIYRELDFNLLGII